nr:immunoglobulin light chain junction region [Macaca mulatta]MOW64370.1 immunoglobulin light chain junction region [Macaca mulatta]
CQKYVSSPLTF